MGACLDTFPICRLSFYLKCCTVGCGLAPSIEPSLIDYSNAHRLTIRAQHHIFQLCRSVFNPMRLVDRVYYLDDGREILPSCASNAFVDVETFAASSLRHASLAVQVKICGRMVTIRKLMVCTSDWLNKFYIFPLRTMQLEETFKNVKVLPANGETSSSASVAGGGGHCSHCHGLDGAGCACDEGCSVSPTSHCAAVHCGVLCDGCVDTINDTRGSGICGPRYKCLVCTNRNYCEECYKNGEHDQTHVFERIRSVGVKGERLPVRAMLLEGDESDEGYPLAETAPLEMANLFCP